MIFFQMIIKQKCFSTILFWNDHRKIDLNTHKFSIYVYVYAHAHMYAE